MLLVDFTSIFLLGQSLETKNAATRQDQYKVSEEAMAFAFKGDRDSTINALNRFVALMQVREFDFMGPDIAPFFRAAILFHALENPTAEKWLYPKGIRAVSQMPDNIDRDRKLALLARLIPKNMASAEFFNTVQATCERPQPRSQIIASISFAESGFMKMPTWKEIGEQKLIVSPNATEGIIPKEWNDGVKLAFTKFAELRDADYQAVCVASFMRSFSDGSPEKKKMVCQLLTDEKRIAENVRKRWSREFDEGDTLKKETEAAKEIVIRRVGQSRERNPTVTKLRTGPGLAAKITLNSAVKHANEVDIYDDRSKMFSGIADRQLEIGDLEGAQSSFYSTLKCKSLLMDDEAIGFTLDEIAAHMVIRRYLDGVPTNRRNEVLSDLAWDLVVTNLMDRKEYKEARQCAKKISREKQRQALLDKINDAEQGKSVPGPGVDKKELPNFLRFENGRIAI